MNWVSVKDRLPKEDESIQFWVTDGNHGYTATYEDFSRLVLGWQFSVNDSWIGHDDITHWCMVELPK